MTIRQFLPRVARPRRVESVGGVDSIYYREHGAGPPLLLVHGLMIEGEMFAPVLDALAKHHRVRPDELVRVVDEFFARN